MGGRRKSDFHRRERKNLRPMNNRGRELAAELAGKDSLTPVQVARLLRKRGYKYAHQSVRKLRHNLGITPVALEKLQEADISAKHQLERASNLSAIRDFKTLTKWEQIERLERSSAALSDLKAEAGKIKSKGARREIDFTIMRLQTRVNMFSRFLPQKDRNNLMKRGIIR